MKKTIFDFNLLHILYFKCNDKVEITIYVIHNCELYEINLDLMQRSIFFVELEVHTIGLHSLHTLLRELCFKQQQQQQRPMDEEHLDKKSLSIYKGI